MSRHLLLAGFFLLSSAAPAQEPKPKLKGSKKERAPKIDLGLPTFGALPTGDGMKKLDEKAPTERSSPTSVPAYGVVSVQHGKGFVPTPTGSKPSLPFLAVTASGSPLVTEKFSTVVRVRSSELRSASIEVLVLDPRGDTVMDANGELAFKADETEWSVDWAPTAIRAPGAFEVVVRVGGQPLGTFPLTIDAKK